MLMLVFSYLELKDQQAATEKSRIKSKMFKNKL